MTESSTVACITLTDISQHKLLNSKMLTWSIKGKIPALNWIPNISYISHICWFESASCVRPINTTVSQFCNRLTLRCLAEPWNAWKMSWKCHSSFRTPPYLHLATSEMRCWYWGRRILTELSLCYSSVYHYNGAHWYKQFLHIGRLYPALILLDLAVLSSKHPRIVDHHGAIYT